MTGGMPRDLSASHVGSRGFPRQGRIPRDPACKSASNALIESYARTTGPTQQGTVQPSGVCHRTTGMSPCHRRRQRAVTKHVKAKREGLEVCLKVVVTTRQC